jgi:hypothetical protein
MQAPQDGVDGVNAVTVNQPLAAAANELAWLKKPTAAAPASPGGLDVAYVQPIRAARNVRGLRRDFDDHRGIASLARITRWQENWEDVAFLTPKTASGHWAKEWDVFITPGSSSTPQVLAQLGSPFIGGGANIYNGTTLILDTGAVPGPGACIIAVQRNSGTYAYDDADIAFQWELALGPPIANVETVVGMFASGASATGLFASTNPIGFGLYTGPGHATHCALYHCDGTGAGAFIDLGANGDNSTRFRLEYQGVNTADDSTARILVYGDGDPTKPLANIGFSIPLSSGTPVYLQPLYRLLSQGGRQINRWGVTDFAAVRNPGDNAY